MIWVDVLMSVEEAHAYVFLLVIPGILVPLQLHTQKALTLKATHEGTGWCIMLTVRQATWPGALLKHSEAQQNLSYPEDN